VTDARRSETDTQRRETLEAIADEVRTCTACRLHRGRTRAVPGEGSSETEVVFVGEGPGANEDQQGRPFVGAAGGLLTELISSIGWKRDEVFITNVVKCRPPGNRDPEPDEIAACSGYLHRQLEALDPALVVTLGRFSLQTFMPGARISGAHGTVRPVDPLTGAADASVMALYHPAAAFRQATLKETLYEDIAGAPDALIRSRERRAEHRPVLEAPAPDPAAVTEPAPDPALDAEPSMGDGGRGTADDAPVEAPPDFTQDLPSLIDAEPASPDIAPEAALVAADDPNQMRFF
jgi:uracil-DNA glycosylase family 4